MNEKEIIIATVSMRDIADKYGIRINRQGFCCCPFHNENTPSMKFYDNSDGFYCFGCGVGGDVVNFVQRFFELTYNQALFKINDDFNLGLGIGKKPTYAQIAAARQLVIKRKQEQSRLIKLIDNLDEEIFNGLERLSELNSTIKEKKPHQINENIDPAFFMALREKEHLNYLLDIKELKKREYEQRRNNAYHR